jgi:hypothetical protein
VQNKACHTLPNCSVPCQTELFPAAFEQDCPPPKTVTESGRYNQQTVLWRIMRT